MDDELRLQLVDLDGVWVPVGREWPRADAGHPGYRRPKEDGGLRGVRLDAFPPPSSSCRRWPWPADPGLWKLHTQENLIFRAAHFARPRGTPLRDRLARSPDPHVAALAARLATDCGRAPGQAGTPEELVSGLHP
ncbi:hypothetical protein [Streptomyces sp. NPDC047071]|uniref:hypothetical protein n=1 Tax=Streptomyces sp. NPDC047071 TaxID=3154808 RepID=UPI003455CA65